MHIHVIETAENNAKHHLHNAQNNRHFHLERVDEGDFVIGQSPSRINSERVRTTCITVVENWVQLVCVSIMRMMQLEATKEDIQCDKEKLTVQVQELFSLVNRTIRCPTTSVNIDRLGEDIVVDDASINTEQAHHENDVSTAKDRAENLHAKSGYSLYVTQNS